jgi:hypothetical protein
MLMDTVEIYLAESKTLEEFIELLDDASKLTADTHEAVVRSVIRDKAASYLKNLKPGR